MCPHPLTPGGPDGRELVTAGLTRPQANTGLIWDRYLPIWEGNDRDPQLKRPKTPGADDRTSETRAALTAFVKTYEGGQTQAQSSLREAAARQRRALEAWAGQTGQTLTMVTVRCQSRLATGLGVDHPTENGFAFDLLSGLPVVRGTGLKGLCRSTATALLGWDDDHLTQMFGPAVVTAETTAGKGKVAFHDALPTRWPGLEVDVFTPHHKKYNLDMGKKKDKKAVPTETENPVPVFFLTITPPAEFAIPLLTPGESEAREVVTLLQVGLTCLGLGAKTAVGYGRMTVLDPHPGS